MCIELWGISDLGPAQSTDVSSVVHDAHQISGYDVEKGRFLFVGNWNTIRAYRITLISWP